MFSSTIEAIQIELDPEKRASLHHELHRFVFDLQPYMFWFNPPTMWASVGASRATRSAAR